MSTFGQKPFICKYCNRRGHIEDLFWYKIRLWYHKLLGQKFSKMVRKIWLHVQWRTTFWKTKMMLFLYLQNKNLDIQAFLNSIIVKNSFWVLALRHIRRQAMLLISTLIQSTSFKFKRLTVLLLRLLVMELFDHNFLLGPNVKNYQIFAVWEPQLMQWS